MLLAQKAYAEGGAGAQRCTARGSSTRSARADPRTRARDAHAAARDPDARSRSRWPSQWCLAANDLAIQVHGGYGYTRDYPVEQLYRDNRLNPIHEGTHGIQALDLLGRKVSMDGGAGARSCSAGAHPATDRAGAGYRATPTLGAGPRRSSDAVAARRTDDAARCTPRATPERTLANATRLPRGVRPRRGRLDLARAGAARRTARSGEFYDGKRQACRYFFRWELPRTGPQFALLDSLDDTTLAMRDAWF
ncbi:MAG: acyl-CoA dehydrogenase [Comamonadaceae bacterium]|nr:acyl-CoA dehydrogenase [Comamonadaceae bacterium]